MSATFASQPPHDLRDERADVDEAGDLVPVAMLEGDALIAAFRKIFALADDGWAPCGEVRVRSRTEMSITLHLSLPAGDA